MLAMQASQVAGPIGWDAEPLLCTPPIFSRLDSPLDYGYRSFYGGDPDTYKAGATTLVKLENPTWERGRRVKLSGCEALPPAQPFHDAKADSASLLDCLHSNPCISMSLTYWSGIDMGILQPPIQHT